MKGIIIALVLLSVIPIAQAINITCSSSAICSGDTLIRVNDCYANSDQFYVNESISCPDGCDPVSGRCNPPIDVNPNKYLPVTNLSCSDENTLMIESREYNCVGSSCKWLNTTTYQHCDNGCYENVDEQGAGCSPTEFNILVYSMIFFFAFIVIIIAVFGKRRGRR